MKTSFPKGSEDPYLNHKKVNMNFKVYLLRVIQYKMKLSSLEVYHSNICHHVFHG